jgi:hypothetical protein
MINSNFLDKTKLFWTKRIIDWIVVRAQSCQLARGWHFLNNYSADCIAAAMSFNLFHGGI